MSSLGLTCGRAPGPSPEGAAEGIDTIRLSQEVIAHFRWRPRLADTDPTTPCVPGSSSTTGE